MKRVGLLLMSFMLILTSCDKDDDLRGRPDFSAKGKDKVTFDNGPGNGRQISDAACEIQKVDDKWVTPLIAGQNKEVGTVKVEIVENHIIVTYQTKPGWYLIETHLHVSGELAGFPINNGGNPQIGQFKYGNLHAYKEVSGNTVVYTIPKGEIIPGVDEGCYFVAAHAVVQGIGTSGGNINLNAFAEILPKTATVKVDNPPLNTESYFKVRLSNAGILDGIWSGWCVQTGVSIDPKLTYYGTDVYSSYQDLSGYGYTSDFLIKLNWIINQEFTQNGFTYGEVQIAIWCLKLGLPQFNKAALEATSPPNPLLPGIIGLPDPDKINLILDEVKDVTHFVPPCGGVIAVVLIDDEHQDLIIEYPVVCKSGKETAWGQGCRFNDRGNWAMYFKVGNCE
jgi:hypothetical protein